MSDTLDLARRLIAKLRERGHKPYVDAYGSFGILMRKERPATPDEHHHLGAGYSYTFGFDDRPFAALRDDPNYILALIAAVRESEAFSAHVAGIDQ